MKSRKSLMFFEVVFVCCRAWIWFYFEQPSFLHFNRHYSTISHYLQWIYFSSRPRPCVMGDFFFCVHFRSWWFLICLDVWSSSKNWCRRLELLNFLVLDLFIFICLLLLGVLQRSYPSDPEPCPLSDPSYLRHRDLHAPWEFNLIFDELYWAAFLCSIIMFIDVLDDLQLRLCLLPDFHLINKNICNLVIVIVNLAFSKPVNYPSFILIRIS